MTRVSPLVLALATPLLAALAACEGTASQPDADPGPDTTGETFTVTLGPINVPAGGENTQCVQKKIGNLDHKWIGKLHTKLQGVSHHLIVYKIAGNEEILEPFDCTPFLETLNPEKGTPFMVSQIKEEHLDLPFGVAFGIEPDQVVRLEMHFVNPGETAADVSAEVVFEVLPDAQFRHEAGFLFIGNPDIDIAAGATMTLGPSWFPIPEELIGTKVFGMTGHTHQWGTDVRVEWEEFDGAEPNPVYVYEDWDWEEPPLAKFQPALELTANSGFRFACDYTNNGQSRVGFGESAEDEMCFFWAYYYPSQGHKVCAHTEMLGPPINLCCPGPSSLCDMILDYLQNL